jgi:hypothetical protein
MEFNQEPALPETDVICSFNAKEKVVAVPVVPPLAKDVPPT